MPLKILAEDLGDLTRKHADRFGDTAEARIDIRAGLSIRGMRRVTILPMADRGRYVDELLSFKRLDNFIKYIQFKTYEKKTALEKNGKGALSAPLQQCADHEAECLKKYFAAIQESAQDGVQLIHRGEIDTTGKQTPPAIYLQYDRSKENFSIHFCNPGLLKGFLFPEAPRITHEVQNTMYEIINQAAREAFPELTGELAAIPGINGGF